MTKQQQILIGDNKAEKQLLLDASPLYSNPRIYFRPLLSVKKND